MANCDAQELAEVGRCFGCLDDRQSVIVLLELLKEILLEINPMANCDVNDLLERGKCFGCLDTRGFWMVGLQFGCEILDAGASGQVCNRCEEFDPNASPTCDCAHWTNTASGEMWYWRPLTATWVKYISNK